jgi:hypothetical protein
VEKPVFDGRGPHLIDTDIVNVHLFYVRSTGPLITHPEIQFVKDLQTTAEGGQKLQAGGGDAPQS